MSKAVHPALHTLSRVADSQSADVALESVYNTGIATVVVNNTTSLCQLPTASPITQCDFSTNGRIMGELV